MLNNGNSITSSIDAQLEFQNEKAQQNKPLRQQVRGLSELEQELSTELQDARIESLVTCPNFDWNYRARKVVNGSG
jgi:hypothetical protein